MADYICFDYLPSTFTTSQLRSPDGLLSPLSQISILFPLPSAASSQHQLKPTLLNQSFTMAFLIPTDRPVPQWFQKPIHIRICSSLRQKENNHIPLLIYLPFNSDIFTSLLIGLCILVMPATNDMELQTRSSKCAAVSTSEIQV